MKALTLALAALAFAAGSATAQSDQRSAPNENSQPSGSVQGAQSPGSTRSDRMDKTGTHQTYDTGATGSQVGKDPGAVPAAKDTARTDDYASDVPREDRGTGVATGFIAAGLGLAILGLFVRRRSRRHPRDDYGSRPGGPTGGAGPRI